ncbi:MAG: hypothetical protein ABI585_01680 [Betaproteobacteria bacterium]
MADGDDGYVKSVVRTGKSYVAPGVGGILPKDQERERKSSAPTRRRSSSIWRSSSASFASRPPRARETLIIGRPDVRVAARPRLALE